MAAAARRPVVTVYSRVGCHLCEQAEAVAARLRDRADVRVVDIDADPALAERYTVRVPVVVVDDVEVAQYEVDPVLLEAAVDRAAGRAPERTAHAPVDGRTAAPGDPPSQRAPGPVAAPSRRPSRAAWLAALLLHAAVGVLPLSATGLLAPPSGVVAVYAVWGLLLAVLVARRRRGSWALLAVPVAALVAWAAIVTAWTSSSAGPR